MPTILLGDGASLQNEQIVFIVLIQLAVIILAARALAASSARFGQPAVVGEIAAGILLGPSCFGRLCPGLSAVIFDHSVDVVFGALSELGLILLVFVVGLEFDFSHVRQWGKAAVGMSVVGTCLPFLLGAGIAPLIWPYLEPIAATGRPVPFLGFVLFMGTAMSITAVPVLGRIMVELNITRTRLGAVVISAAAVGDAVGWTLLATVSSIVQANFQPWRTVGMIGATLGFFLLMLFAIGPIMKRFLRRAIVRGGGDLQSGSLAILYAAVFLCAMITNRIGIFAVFGAFLLGTVLSSETAVRDVMTSHLRAFLTVIFLPIFFTYTGLRTDMGALHVPVHWLIFVGILVCAVLGKMGGCAFAARIGGFSSREAICAGAMMNTRGLMELVVVNVGRELGVIPDSVFCMLVLMSLVTNVMTMPLVLTFMPGTELEPFIRESRSKPGVVGDL
jgi:Kef-type K+ transport system membrane component KefB